MNVAFYIFVVLCWTSSQATAATLFNNNETHAGKEFNSKADSALPILHIVFDVASGANAQTLTGATRRLLNVLLPQNVAQNFDSETMMSISTFTGSDSGDGNYLKVLSPPINVVQNFQALSDIIQFNVTSSVTNDVTRDPGAAIRDVVSFSSQFNPGAGDILYLVSRKYVDGGSTVKELEMIDTLLPSNVTLICVEGANINDPNRLFNLERIAELTEGRFFTNTDIQTNSWPNTNDAAINLMLNLAKSPIDSVRRVVGRKEYSGVSDVPQTGSFVITSDLGINSVITVQSSQKGTVTVALTNIQTGVADNLMTKGGTNWNMINANLYVDALDLPPGENRGRWTYELTFEPDIDALDTKSDVVILGLSTENRNPSLGSVPGVWASNCNLNFPDQTTIYAEVIGYVGVVTGLSVTVNITNVEDTSSQDEVIVLTEEVQGMGLYSGIFIPRSEGVYNFSADFEADTDSVCIEDSCAPNDFFASGPGRCQIQVEIKDINTTTTVGSSSSSVSTNSPIEGSSIGSSSDSTTVSPDGSTSNPTTDNTNNESTIAPIETTPTERPTGNSTDAQTVSTGNPTAAPPPNAGFIIGLCLGIGFLIAFLLILIYCCLIAQKEEDEERGSSVPESVLTTPPRSFAQKWRLGLIPPAVLRKPPAIASSSLSSESTSHKTMDDKLTDTPIPYGRKDASILY